MRWSWGFAGPSLTLVSALRLTLGASQTLMVNVVVKAMHVFFNVKVPLKTRQLSNLVRKKQELVPMLEETLTISPILTGRWYVILQSGNFLKDFQKQY